MWWTVLIGVPLGIAQVFAMRYYVSALGSKGGGKKNSKRLIAAVINIAVVLGLITGFALLGEAALLWGISGMCVTMIVMTIVLYVKNMRN